MKLAVVANVMTPYRLHFHRRLQQEIPDLDLHTLLTGEEPELPWRMDVCDLKPVRVRADLSAGAGPLSRFLQEWRLGGAILRYLDENEIDAVVVNGYSDTVRLRVIGGCRRVARPVLLRGDSNIRGDRRISPARRWAKKRVIRWATARTDAILVMGELGREYFRTYGRHGVPVFTVPCDLDVSTFQEVEEDDVLAFCTNKGLDLQRRRLLFVGRLVDVKAVDDLLSAFVRIAQDRQGWDLAIAGSGPLEDRLKAMVPSTLTQRVSWLGFIDHDDLPLVYKASHLLVIPSHKEPWAVVVSEALAAGLPVIASDAVGAGYELLRDGEGGVIFPASDVDALADALRHATTNEGWRALAAGVPLVFNRWRTMADPVAGMAAALRFVTESVES